jgi:restriction endonuclease S subunit
MDCWPSDTTFYLEPDTTRVETDYLYYWLSAHPLSGDHAKTTLPSLQKPDLEQLELWLPPTGEQQRIARILSTVGTALVATTSAISKRLNVRALLLKELLDGPVDDAAWPLVSLPELIDFKEGPGIMASDFRGAGTPLVRLSGITSRRSVLEGCNFLDPTMVASRWSHFRVSAGDTLVSTSASLGRVAVVGMEAVDAIPYTGIIRMRPRDQRLIPQFLPYLFQSSIFQRQAERSGIGSIMRHFGPSHLRSMTLPVPSIAGQRRIIHALSASDASIDAWVISREKLNEIFRQSLRRLLGPAE